MRIRGGPGLKATLHLAGLAAGASPAVLRRGGIATAIGMSRLRSPNRAALVRDHDSMTGRELDAALQSTADAIAERYAPGTPLGIRGDGGIDFLVVLGAAVLAGVDAVAVGPRSGALDVECLDSWEVFVRSGGFETRRRRRRPSASVKLLSTGTTGEPTVTARGRLGLRGTLQLADADRRLRIPEGTMLVLAPPDHGHGLTMVLAGLIRGRTVVLASGMRPAEQAQAAVRHRVRTISGVPAQLGRLLDESPHAFDGVELVVSGSSKLPDALRSRLEAHGARVLDCYGSTETGTVAIEGRPLAGVTIDVDAGHDIRITSPLGGRARTPGDTGRIVGGRLVVTGRRGDTVDSGGELVVPGRIEAVLRELDGVTAARVWAEDDDLLGSRLCADVVVSDETDAAALARELTARLGKASVPRSLVVSRE